MARKGVLVRPLTRQECPWLDEDLPAGKTVYRFSGYTYGCISDNGVAVSDKPGTNPFYEVPTDSVSWDPGVVW